MSTNLSYQNAKSKLRYGAAYAFAEAQFGGPVTIIDSVKSVLNGGSFLIPANPDRVALVVINVGTSVVSLSVTQQGSTANGILLTNQGSIMSLTLRDDYTLPAQNFWANALGGGTIYVVEYARIFA